MSALYCYMVSFYSYNDSEFIPIFHKKKYSEQEFQEICTQIFNEISDNDNKRYTWDYPTHFIQYAKKHGFRDIDVLEVDTVTCKVNVYGEF